MLELSKIKTHEASQAREEINESKIAEYADHITNGGSFPPIIVFYDSTSYWLADGWHRLLATKRVGCLTILEEIHVGGQRDALKYALGANSKHGLPRTNADKRKAVGIALNDAEWSKLPTREIAEMCSVSHNLVAEMQRGLTPSDKTEKNNSVNVYKDEQDNSVIGLQPTKTVNNSQDVPEANVEPEIEVPQYEEFHPSDEEIAESIRHDEEQNSYIKKLLESDDPLAQAIKDVVRYKALARISEERFNGLQGEKIELIRMIKSLQNKLSKAGVK